MKRILAIAAALLLLGGCASAPDNTEPSATPSTGITQTTVAPETTVPTTTPAETTVPPTTAPSATTQPAANGDALIGSLYARAQLETMDNTNFGCPTSGNVDEHNRPTISMHYNDIYGKYDAHFIAPDDGKVYLTFTLGYEHQNLTASILDTMKEKDVKGIFIINMHYARSCPELVQRMIDEGHIVGNHSAGHYTLSELSIDRVVEEIMELHNYVLDHFGYKMTVFRPPSGYSSERVLAIAQSLGYTTVNYSFAYYDWDTSDQPDPATSLQNLLDRIHSGAIIQLHCVSATNAQILGDAIDGIREKGLEFSDFS